ncbi:P22AR C-terminal domain-containing protein [Aggregatibacter actinomycetemcomitans]|uniref:P22AR C-terminal domain-containing protein n=2 Tax=Aggregatibacter actinomycetemcomitans TaxID=714 RepID=UPI002150E507|nr:P22AR C-terminal domain-containing protein [Aggregatibacter actinomycetemcomitans]
MTTLTFQTTTLSVINQHNQTYFTSSELGKGLGYANPLQSVTNLYNSNADEFTAEMTALIDMPTAGGVQKVRIFSLRGAHLIAMFARTKVAKAFRRWVLDILDREAQQPKQLALPQPEKTYTVTLTEYELQTVAWACFAFRRNNNLLHELYSPLAAIGSKFAVEARDNAVEYRNTLRRFNEVVKRITVDIEADPETNWRVLKHIRSFNEKIFGRVDTDI